MNSYVKLVRAREREDRAIAKVLRAAVAQACQVTGADCNDKLAMIFGAMLASVPEPECTQLREAVFRPVAT